MQMAAALAALRRATGRWLHRTLSAAVNTWLANAQELQRQQQLVKKGLMRMVQRKLAMAFGTWREHAAVMKELLRQRHRSKGVTLDPKGGTELEAPPEDADEQSQGTHNLSATFTAQTEAGEVDPKMLQYIEEQMRKEEGAQETLAPSVDPDEEELYTTAAHLQV